jgi:hypothetical protein
MYTTNQHGTDAKVTAFEPQADRSGTPTTMPRSFLGRVFGVYLDPRTWGSLLFMMLSLVTGILYFTWAVTGLSLSLGFAILIIGAPFALLFLLSVRGLASLEQRFVELMLGVQIPRPQPGPAEGPSWLGRLKALITERRTWVSLLYLMLQLPLGVAYFTLAVFLIAFSLGLIAIPLASVFGNPQSIAINGQVYTWQPWIIQMLVVAGFLMFTWSLHVIRGIGQWHGKYVKGFLGG